MSVALARKYRPKTFADVAVQSHVSNTLKGAIARGRVAHGYLLCGPRGTGKTTLARVLAMALNCERRAEHPDGEPCGECTSCRRIWSGASSMDVVEIDAASNRGVDDARELRERAMYAPSGEDRHKVYIVDEAHMLTREAWNALLKVLEEPPPRVVFVFATTEPQKIAQAAAPVLSRLQRFDLKRIGPGEIRERLAAVLDAERVSYEADALGVIARAADGGLRDALSLADQVISLGADARVTADRAREALGLVPEDEYLAVLALVAEGRAGEVFAHVGRLAEAGADFGLFLTGVGDLLRAQLAVALGGSAPDVGEATRAALAERADPAHPAHLAPADLVRMLQLLVEAEPRFRKSGQQQLLLETLLVRFALMDRAVALEDVLRGLQDGGDAGAGGADAGGPAARDAGPPVPRDGGGRGGAPVRDAPRDGGRDAGRDAARRPSPAGGGLRAAYEAAVSEAAPAGPGRGAPQASANGAGGAGAAGSAPAAVLERPVAPAYNAPPSADDFAPVDDADGRFDDAPPFAPPAPRAGAPANGSAPSGGAPARYGPDGARGNGSSPNGASPNGASPNGASPNGASPNGASPHAAAPNPAAPNGAAASGATPAGSPADLAALAAAWDAVVDAARAQRPLVGSALANARPVAVTGGTVHLELLDANDTYRMAVENAPDVALGAVRRGYPAAARVVVRGAAAAAGNGAPRERLTAEGIRAERLATLAQRNPVLGAAIEALDLDLLD